MWLQISLFVIKLIIFFNHQDFISAHPMYGPNVKNVRSNEFSYIASLSRAGNNDQHAALNHVCTGVLVTKQDVLTSASCFIDEDWNAMVVRLGSVNLNTARRYSISWWIDYNDWMNSMNENPEYDSNEIGNIRIAEQVEDTFELATLSPLPTSDLYEQQVVIAGWGRNARDVIPLRMHKADLLVLGMESCRRIISNLGGRQIRLHSRHLCSASLPHAVMHLGETGAPVMLDGMVIAIHKSTAPSPGDVVNPQKLNIHSTINYYRNFIEHVTSEDYNLEE